MGLTLPASSAARASDMPLVAVVLPVFKHSVLVTEAIRSALLQQTDFAFKLVVVNDGCPFPETHDTLLAHTQAFPDRIAYVRRANGGLSAARNTGIDYILKALPTVEAIYLLDADNRLFPHALQRCWDTLEAAPECGWAYPDFDMFGLEINACASVDYSILKHLAENFCEAGSMIRRELFEQGLRFDEDMKLGYEDWDFWLQAAGRGHIGRRVETMGFRYRKRPESMLSNSDRDRHEILGYMRRKHRTLYNPPCILAAEHREAPRYAICLGDTGEVVLTTDPACPAVRMSWSDFTVRFLGAWANPDREHCPNFLVFTTQAVLDALGALRTLHWCLWRMEDALEGSSRFAALALAGGQRAGSLSIVNSLSDQPLGITRSADLLMTTRRIFQECVADAVTGWVCSLADAAPQPPVFELQLETGAPFDRGPVSPGCGVINLFQAFYDIRNQYNAGSAPLSAEWRVSFILAQSDLHLVSRDLVRASPLLPRIRAHDGERNVGFLLPLVSFGGVEKVAINLARGLRGQGWQPHLFVFASCTVDNLEDLTEVFATINFLDDRLAEIHDPAGRFFGTEFTAWMNRGDHGRAVGLLCGMDVVINAHSTDALAIMGTLRRAGVVTVGHLHLVERGPGGEPMTNGPYRTVAYEHAFDAILVISRQLRDWCRAMGVPDGKLLLAPNAPSYTLGREDVTAIMADRRKRPAAPLRVAFIGRFDRQKGIERLVALIRASSRNPTLQIEWRVVGGAVLTEDHAQNFANAIEPHRHPPARSPAELTEHLAWADVLVQTSHFEGVPLMLLEAMRVGAVPVATDVGAVCEIVKDGHSGCLIENGPPHAVVAAMIKRLAGFAADRPRLLEMAEQACAWAEQFDWDRTAHIVSGRLEQILAGKAGGAKAKAKGNGQAGTDGTDRSEPEAAAPAAAADDPPADTPPQAAPASAGTESAEAAVVEAAVAVTEGPAAAGGGVVQAGNGHDDLVSDLQARIDTALRPLFRTEAYAFLNWPDYPNTGDHLIWLGAQVYLRRRLGLSPVYCRSSAATRIEELQALPREVPIVLTGGGNFGDLWEHHQLFREEVVKACGDRRIIVLPQTVHFQDGRNLQRAVAAFSGHCDLHLLARDHVSHETLKAHFPDNDIGLAPDMAVFLADIVGPVCRRISQSPVFDTLYLLRSDAEMVPDRGTPEAGPHLVDWAGEAGLHGVPLVALAAACVEEAGAGDLVQTEEDRVSWARFVFGCALLSRGRRIVTDRLHGHILSLVMHKENVLLDNSYSKNRTFLETWTRTSRLSSFQKSLGDAFVRAEAE